MKKWIEYNIPNRKNKYLIRFLSKKRLIEFLDNGNIWFPRADTFGDKMECVSIDDLNTKSFNIEKLELRKQKHLISCWHASTNESIAMWDTSFKKKEDQRVFAIRFNYDDLVRYISINKFEDDDEGLIEYKFYGQVRYKNLLRKELDQKRMRRVAFRKEYSFKYENEFRFVVQSDKAFLKKGYAFHIGESSALNYSIMVNPLLDQNEYKEHLSFLKSNKIGRVKHQDSALVRWLKPSQW